MQNSAEIVAVRSPTLEATQNIKRKLCALPTHKRTDSLHRLFLNCVQNTRKEQQMSAENYIKLEEGNKKQSKRFISRFNFGHFK
jgi:predicted secreted protein